MKNRRDLAKTVLALIYFGVSLYIMCISNAISDRLNINAYVEPAMKVVLPDPLMQNFAPYFDRLHIHWDVNDLMLTVFIIITFVRFSFIGNTTCTILRRMLMTWGTCQFLRAFTVDMTILPNPYPYCLPHIENNVFLHAFYIATRQRVSCGDVFFSGHTVSYTMCMLVWLRYSHDLLRVLAPAVSFSGMIIIILSRYHYAIDVIAGFCLCLFVWNYIHWSIEIPQFRQRSAMSRLIYRVDCIDVPLMSTLLGDEERGSLLPKQTLVHDDVSVKVQDMNGPEPLDGDPFGDEEECVV
jgi:hypothetical protein